MKKRWKSILIPTIMVISAFLIIYHTAIQDMVENEELLEYWEVASQNSLGIYFTSTDPIEVAFYPTPTTELIMERWEIIANIYEEVIYPEEAINNNDWLKADAIMEEWRHEMRVENKGDEFEQIMAFIYSGSVRDHVQQKFNKAGIEYE
ncbi:hypothetical protein [Salipaludibacillus agaradhaerens]|uniref:hypothetical protein n=1 Tax=Salipaludibacillus agaradhaerens TaxID=76935 RepID=UPI00117C863E|nr:hypothetical protein [Salipaludibacillus agaradhaerens]